MRERNFIFVPDAHFLLMFLKTFVIDNNLIALKTDTALLIPVGEHITSETAHKLLDLEHFFSC